MKAGDYIQAVEGAIINQPKYWAKHHNDRVTADGGTVTDKTPEEQRSYLTDYYKFLRETRLIDNLVFSWDGSSGIKTRTSGINQYATKLYDMSAGNRDATETTEANQSHVSGLVAPNEQRKLKGLTGETGVKRVAGTDIQIASSSAFTLAIAVKWNYPRTSSRIYLSETNYIELTASSITLRGDSGNVLTCAHTFRTGLTEILTFEYNNGVGLIRVNGVEKTTTVTSDAVTFGSLFLSQTSNFRNFDGEIGKLQIANIRLSASQIQSLYNFTRLQHPEIEGINIGNQHWATSNYEGVVTGNGTAIPEIQAAGNSSVTVVNGTFDSDLTGWNVLTQGAWFWDGGMAKSNGISGNIDQLILTKNTWYKIMVDVVISSGSVSVREGTNGMSATLVNGSNTVYIKRGNATSRLGYLAFVSGALIGSIDNVSVEEVGWSGLQEMYNGLIAQGQTVEQATRNCAAWCYYDNNPLNGAVYGKLYNWYAVQAIAANPPAGWRVPTEADFLQLANYLGGVAVAGGKMKKEGLTYWKSPNTSATNETGFTALPGGYRNNNGSFDSIGYNGYWWSATENDTNGAWYLNMNYNRSNVLRYYDSKEVGFSVRLIRNEPVGSTERNIETGYITNALGATNLDISIPFGYQVESICFDSETNITGLSAKLLTGALVELETLFTAKAVTANVQKIIAADADQSIQQTDAVVRINGTKALTSARFRVWIKLTKVVFS